MSTATEIDPRALAQLEEKFDPEMRFRPTVQPATAIVMVLLIALSCFHYYTAVFGLLRGFVQEGLAILAWVAAALAIRDGHAELSAMLHPVIGTGSGASVAA